MGNNQQQCVKHKRKFKKETLTLKEKKNKTKYSQGVSLSVERTRFNGGFELTENLQYPQQICKRKESSKNIGMQDMICRIGIGIDIGIDIDVDVDRSKAKCRDRQRISKAVGAPFTFQTYVKLNYLDSNQAVEWSDLVNCLTKHHFFIRLCDFQ